MRNDYTNALISRCINTVFNRATAPLRQKLYRRREKGRDEECGALALVVFLEGGSLCFQLGNVQAKLKVGEWCASQRLHCLNSD